LIVGLVATAVMDIWGVVRKPLLGLPVADYRLVGRWISYFARGKFRHESIAKAPATHGEVMIGWLAHYLLGLGFAAALLALVGTRWVQHPTLGGALTFGLATVLMPFLVMQPAMGQGVAASRAPRPAVARIQSVVTHIVFGLGLFAGGWAAHLFYTTGD
jgi:energy-converting hydrogenase Eha subunit B